MAKKATSKKELIRQTAIEVMAELGFRSTTTDKIAQAAGISVGTIYNYFASKEEILEYIFTVELEKRTEMFRAIDALPISTMEKLKNLLQKHFAAIAKDPKVGQILVRERQFPHKKELTAIRDFIDGIPAFLAKLLDRAVDEGEIRPCNSQIVGAAIFGSIEAVVRSAVFTPDPSKQQFILAHAATELFDFYLIGLKAD